VFFEYEYEYRFTEYEYEVRPLWGGAFFVLSPPWHAVRLTRMREGIRTGAEAGLFSVARAFLPEHIAALPSLF
jgi:hypothetical protein